MKKPQELFELVQSAIREDSILKQCLSGISIMVNDGAVVLTGSVTSDSLRALARKIVSAVPGVHLLIEDLKVVPDSSRRVGVQIDWANGGIALV